MGEMVGGSILGAVFGEVLKPITGQFHKALKFKATRSKLAHPVELVIPVVEEMAQLEQELDRPKEETGRLMEELQKSKKLLSKHSNIPWWKFCCLPCYQGELHAMDEKVGRSLTLVTQARIARNVTQLQLQVKRGNVGKPFKGPCKAPEKPDFTVGLDRLLNKLKIQLLQSGVSVSVLTGLAGSGKSTLATLLCWDDEVRGKFGENILFVTVSKTPDLKIIMQTLFQHCGLVVPKLVSDEDAVRQLEHLLKEIGESPTVLVLDDVWPGSESLIDAFLVQLSDYKVLVTSRFEFPKFKKTSCRLKPLCPEDAVTLMCHFVLQNDGSSYVPDEQLVKKVARGCWGSPLAIEVISRSLCGQRAEAWQQMKKKLSKGRSILYSSTDLLTRLQKCLNDVLEDKPIIKECFMDLALFPEDQKIPVAALIDIWTELYDQVDDDIAAVNIVHGLIDWHLANLFVTREVASDVDNYYSHDFLMQHDLLKEMSIHQARQEPFGQRKRVIL